MADYVRFTTGRATEPDIAALNKLLHAIDPSVGITEHQTSTKEWRLKTSGQWTPGTINRVQAVLDTAPATTPQLSARATIENWPIDERALVSALLDVVNSLQADVAALGGPKRPDITLASLTDATAAKTDSIQLARSVPNDSIMVERDSLR